ncbi:hypothetical protein ACWNYO_00800 [Candidatus Vidania fulgoroideorum]
MSKIGRIGIKTRGICKILNNRNVVIKNKTFSIKKPFFFFKKKKKIFISVKEKYKKKKKIKIMWGTYRANIKNLVVGIYLGYKKKMIIEGTGYYIKKKNNVLMINAGYSHIVKYLLHKDIICNINNNVLKFTSYNKSLLGNVCNKIKKIFRKSPYKKKGIFFEKENFTPKNRKKK